MLGLYSLAFMVWVAPILRPVQAFITQSPSVFRNTSPFHRWESRLSVSNNPATSVPAAPALSAATIFSTPNTFRAAFALEGLDEELESIRQQVVLPLVTPRALLETLGGIRPVDGLLLSGAPGTGKSSLAIRLAEILSPEPPIVLTGLESAADIKAVLSAPPSSAMPNSTPGTSTTLVQLPQTPPAIDRLVVGPTASNVLARTGGVGGVYEPFEGSRAMVRSGFAVPPVPGYSWLRNDAAPIVKPQLPSPLTPPVDYRQQQAPRKDNTQQRDATAASIKTASSQPQEQQPTEVKKSSEPSQLGATGRLRIVITELDIQSSAESQRALQAHLRAAMDCTAPYQSNGSNNEGLLVIGVARSKSSVLDPSMLARFDVQVELPLLDQPSPHHRVRRAAILARHCASLRRAGRLAVAGLARVPTSTVGVVAADEKAYSEWLLQLADVCGPTLSSGAELAGVVHAAIRRALVRAHALAVASASASDGELLWGDSGQAGTALGDAAVYSEDFEAAAAEAIQRKFGDGERIVEMRPPRVTETSGAPAVAPVTTPAAMPATPPRAGPVTTPSVAATAATISASPPPPPAASSDTPTPRPAQANEADTAREAVEAALEDVKARMAATGWKHWNEESIRAGVEGKKQAAIKSQTAEAAAVLATPTPTSPVAPSDDGGLSFAEVVARMRQEERDEDKRKRAPSEGMF